MSGVFPIHEVARLQDRHTRRVMIRGRDEVPRVTKLFDIRIGKVAVQHRIGVSSITLVAPLEIPRVDGVDGTGFLWNLRQGMLQRHQSRDEASDENQFAARDHGPGSTGGG